MNSASVVPVFRVYRLEIRCISECYDGKGQAAVFSHLRNTKSHVGERSEKAFQRE